IDPLVELPRAPSDASVSKPVWDRDSRTLSFQGATCKTFRRGDTENQMKLIESFDAKDWPESILNPFGVDDDVLRRTITDLNRSLKQSNLGFRVKYRKPEWYKREQEVHPPSSP